MIQNEKNVIFHYRKKGKYASRPILNIKIIYLSARPRKITYPKSN